MTLKRREFLNTLGKTTIGLAGSGALLNFMQSCSSPKGKKWNIVFILSDDQGWNQVDYHGFDFYETPNINSIAEDGIHFTDAYAAAPVCSPTRASIMTGKSPARLHITDYIPGSPFPYAKLITPEQTQGLPMEEITIAELLKEHGYKTGHFGKWHLNKDKEYQPGRPGDPGSQGFDVVFTSVKPRSDADPDNDAHHTIKITERSIKFIEENKNKPFFCYMSFHSVHRPIMENKELVEKYKGKLKAQDSTKNPIMGAMIERMDWGVGEVLNKLDELNLTDKTIVIFVSDNGGLEILQDQAPLRGGKATIFEGGIKVPMAIKWPGVIKPGAVSKIPVITDDLFPTITDMVGIKYAIPDIDGESLVPLSTQNAGLKRDAIYWHYPHYHHLGYKPASAIREGDYKLIEWHEEALYNEKNQINLYNVREDVGEINDLANEMPELAIRLREKLHQWRKAVGAQEMKKNPNYDPQKEDWRFLDQKD
ncbi:MAG: sulfatase [bacterium]|nr:sulfatase [bacterium]